MVAIQHSCKTSTFNRRKAIRFSTLVLGLAFTLVPVCTAYPVYELTPRNDRVVFQDRDGLISLAKWDADFFTMQRAWIDSQPEIPLWTITLLDAAGNPCTVTALDGKATVHRRKRFTLEFEWSNVQPGDLRVLATIRTNGPCLEWDIDVKAQAPGYTLWDVVYPEIGPLALPEKSHSIVPYGWGVIRNDLLSHRTGAVYPSAIFSMPFVAVSDGETGIYAGVHDKKGYAMTLFVGKREIPRCAVIGIKHDVEDMGRATRYQLPYVVTTALYRGDWYEAGRLYREAARKTAWGGIPPLSKRRDIPQWLLDTDLWYLGSCHDDATADEVLKFKNYFNVPISAHIYQWHEIPFDDRYPEYFPSKPGFTDAVRKVQSAGVPVMPYINGRLWDPATESWKADHAEQWCSLDEKGKPYVEVYGSKVPLSPMCPSTPLWQNTVVNLVDRLLNEVGVKAVYIDQISAASAKRCFAENHGHPLGGGTYWIQGYRQLLNKCRAKCPPDSVLTTEENADPWNDQLDAWLMVNTRANGGEIVPLYPAVYGGRAISFGFQYLSGDDFKYRYPFRYKMAAALVFGSQLGWVGIQVLDEANLREAAFLKNLCRTRSEARSALQFGELLSPLVLNNGGVVTWTAESETEKNVEEIPAVYGSAWLTPENERIIVLANIADDSRTIQFTLNRSHLGEGGYKQISLVPMANGLSTTLHRTDRDHWIGSTQVPATDAVAFKVLRE